MAICINIILFREIIKELVESTYKDLNLSRLPKCMDVVRAITLKVEVLIPEYINILFVWNSSYHLFSLNLQIKQHLIWMI